jgi:hypothetical protein
MLSLLKKNSEACSRFQDWLEDAASGHAGDTVAELLAAAPASQREHVTVCAGCRGAAEDFLYSRALLRALPGQSAGDTPWFAPQVMAAITAREAELRQTADAWIAVPKFAARLTLVTAAALLFASTWLYQRPVTAPVKPAATDITGEPIVENLLPASDDDVLVSLSEHSR